MEIAVIGAGSWGTALAKVLADKGYATTLWGRDAAHLAEIERDRVNARYLPQAKLPPTLKATADLESAVAGKAVVVSVVPSHTVRDVFGRAGKLMAPDAMVISASKGIENESLATMDEVLKEVLPGKIGTRLGFLSGPSFAKEVGAGLPTAVVLASRERRVADEGAALFQAERFRVYTSDDVAGVEFGGALKNVMAVATGICEGLGLGFNSRAALITRGLAEMARLGVALGAQPATFAGLAGMGDLVLTCTGALSRNRALGLAVGKGATLAEAMVGKETVAEGVTTARSALKLAERVGVDMPIVAGVHKILFEGKPARESIAELMERELRAESD